MVNESELPINFVMDRQPKMLTGCNQKVSSQARKFKSFPVGDASATGEKAEPKSSVVIKRNVENL